MRRIPMIVLAISGSLSTAHPMRAQPDTILSGIRSVFVTASVAPQCAPAYADTTELLQHVTLGLRRMGIEVAKSSHRWFKVSVECVPFNFGYGEPAMTLYLETALNEWVFARNDSTTELRQIGATTWAYGSLGWTRSSAAVKNINDGVTGLMEHFENEWLAANPRLRDKLKR